jgi:hypothetical protein
MKFFIAVLVFVSGCSNLGSDGNIEIHKENPPALWSGHKVIKISPDLCVLKGESILKSLGFRQIAKRNTNVYGNFNTARAPVKCTGVEGSTFVYVIVADQEKELAENLRNEIHWAL